MRVSYLLGKRALTAVCIIALLAPIGCAGVDRQLSMGLKDGMNFTQPMKWSWVTKFRVQEIKPKTRLLRSRESGWNPSIPAVGKGSYEAWLTKPHEGGALLGVKETYVHPKPNAIETDPKTGATFYYYNFTPDGYLPHDMQAEVHWEFVTFEQYAYTDPNFKGERKEYDKTSELYKKYTKVQKPFNANPRMLPILKECRTEDPHDYIGTAMNAYNYMSNKFEYDQSQMVLIAWRGLEGMTDAYRAWENQHGVCDEITNVYISMLRQMGIPARPCLGFVHQPGFITTPWKRQAGGHAWAEWYHPDFGWVPVDPTWGTTGDPMQADFTLIGSVRKLTNGSYYFGHMDTWRIPIYKDVNYTLKPAPKTPGAKKTEYWNVGFAERFSGVESVTHGWDGVPGMGSGGLGWARSDKHKGMNYDYIVKCLGPPSKAELEELKKQLAESNINYVHAGTIRGDWPIQTMGRDLVLPPPPEEETKEY